MVAVIFQEPSFFGRVIGFNLNNGYFGHSECLGRLKAHIPANDDAPAIRRGVYDDRSDFEKVRVGFQTPLQILKARA